MPQKEFYKPSSIFQIQIHFRLTSTRSWIHLAVPSRRSIHSSLHRHSMSQQRPSHTDTQCSGHTKTVSVPILQTIVIVFWPYISVPVTQTLSVLAIQRQSVSQSYRQLSLCSGHTSASQSHRHSVFWPYKDSQCPNLTDNCHCVLAIHQRPSHRDTQCSGHTETVSVPILQTIVIVFWPYISVPVTQTLSVLAIQRQSVSQSYRQLSLCSGHTSVSQSYRQLSLCSGHTLVSQSQRHSVFWPYKDSQCPSLTDNCHCVLAIH